MALTRDALAAAIGTVTHRVDDRWTMSYAAALGDHNPRYLDTCRADGVVAHPLFGVCIEWDAMLAARAAMVERGARLDDLGRGVHAAHDVLIHRLIRPGDVLEATVEPLGAIEKTPGTLAASVVRLVDADGAPVTTTDYRSLYLGVALADGDGSAPCPVLPSLPARPRSVEPSATATVAIGAGAAHIYTEGARIWNPIHTSPAVAERAGLPAIILHGTATLAHAVTAVVDRHCAGDPARVRRISGRFRAMVRMPSTITVRMSPPDATTEGGEIVWFDVITDDGAAAIDEGAIVVG
jgi:acyl dehydratase